MKCLFGKMTGWICAKKSNGVKILVVDDGQVERKLMTEALGRHGYTVVAAENGEQGVLAACSEKPDLIILDFTMPDINGKEVCLRIKENPDTQHIPVIFLTGSANPKDLVDCYDVGAEYFLNKPISSKMLIKQVEMVLAQVSEKKGKDV